MTEKSILKFVKSCIPSMRLSQQKTLSLSVLSCIRGGGRKLTDMARGMTVSGNLQSRFKRVSRFLSNPLIQIETISQELFQWLIVKECGSLFPVVVLMDWTVEHDKHVLMLSLQVQKRSIPFYWYAIGKSKLIRSQKQH